MKSTSLFSTKFIGLLRTFEADELNAFEKWLRSPWCNRNKNLPRLVKCLKKYYPDFPDSKLSKQALFQQVLPDGKYSSRRMNNLLSEAYQAAEKFLIFESIPQDSPQFQQFLAEAFQNHGLDELFFKTSQRAIDFLEQKEVPDVQDHLTLFQLHRQQYEHPHQHIRVKPGDSAIFRMEESLDLYYLLEKAAILNEKILRKRILRQETHSIEPEIKQWKLLADGKQYPVLDLYRLRFAQVENVRIESYQELYATFIEQMDQLSNRSQKTHLLSLINDSIFLIKTGQLEITESLPLYQLGLETGVLFHQGKLTQNTYSTIVIASNTKGTFDYTTSFIESHSKYLDDALRDDCYHWARAHTAYWQKNLAACLNILQGHLFRSAHFQLICRVLNTQVYFDLYLQDRTYQFFLYNFLDAFEKWLNREQRWSKKNKAAFLRFVQKCRKLARYYDEIEFDNEKVQKLLKEKHPIQALNWLKKKQQEVIGLRSGTVSFKKRE